MSHYLAAMMY